jgi:cytochrome P450
MREAVERIVRSPRGKLGNRDDILERLLRAKNPDTGEAMSDVQVVDNLLTFLRAGLAPDTERLRMMGFPLLASAGGDAQQRQSRADADTLRR